MKKIILLLLTLSISACDSRNVTDESINELIQQTTEHFQQEERVEIDILSREYIIQLESGLGVIVVSIPSDIFGIDLNYPVLPIKIEYIGDMENIELVYYFEEFNLTSIDGGSPYIYIPSIKETVDGIIPNLILENEQVVTIIDEAWFDFDFRNSIFSIKIKLVFIINDTEYIVDALSKFHNLMEYY